MKIDLITLFPEALKVLFTFGPVSRAMENGNLELNLHNLRDFAHHPKNVDDTPYGGGAGMVLKVEPIVKAIHSLRNEKSLVILFDPGGKVLDQPLVRELSEREHLILLAGRYRGIDERVKNFIDMEISIGDYVLSGGEPASYVLIDAISRLLPDSLGDWDSAKEDSFQQGLLGYPVYTRPREFEGLSVPDYLLSGNHKKIEYIRRKESLRRTLQRRPDLLKEALLNEDDRRILREIKGDKQ